MIYTIGFKCCYKNIQKSSKKFRNPKNYYPLVVKTQMQLLDQRDRRDQIHST